MSKEKLLNKIRDIVNCNISNICMGVYPYGDVDEVVSIKVDSLNFIFAPHLAPEDYADDGLWNELRICVYVNDETTIRNLSDDNEYSSFFSDAAVEDLKESFNELTEEEKTFEFRFRRSI